MTERPSLEPAQTAGLVCAHHHLYSALARGMPAPPRTPTEFLEILELVWWRLDRALDADTIYWSAKLGALEALERGCTAIIDHHESPNAIEGSLSLIEQACAEVGVRATEGYSDDMPHIDDLVLAVRLAELGSVGYIDAELYAFHEHGANTHLSPDADVFRNEILPMIAEAFDGPLGRRLPDAAAVRRRVERQALLHLPTRYIFNDSPRIGWMLYWRAVRERPILTIVQPRTISLVARTVLGDGGYTALRSRVARLAGRRG